MLRFAPLLYSRLYSSLLCCAVLYFNLLYFTLLDVIQDTLNKRQLGGREGDKIVVKTTSAKEVFTYATRAGKGRKEGGERMRLVVYINNQNLTTNVVLKLRSIGPSSSDTHTLTYTQRREDSWMMTYARARARVTSHSMEDTSEQPTVDSTRYTISFFAIRPPQQTAHCNVQHHHSNLLSRAHGCSSLLCDSLLSDCTDANND